MTAYTEIELRCDGVEGDPFGCDAVVYDGTATRARVVAGERGWLTARRGGKDLCPKYRPRRAAEPS
jgi:hypothetical protein